MTMKKFIYFISILLLPSVVSAQVLSLDSCKALALENNKKIKEAQFEIEASEQIKKSAFTKYFPNISAAGVAMKSNKHLLEVEVPEMNLPVYDGNPMSLMTPTEFAYFPGMNLEILDYANAGFVTAIQPVFAGGRIYYGNQLAKLGIEVNKLKRDLSKEEVLLDTEYYFWSLMSLKEKMKTIASYQQMLEQLQKDAQIAYEAGLIQKTDLLKVKLELSKLQSNQIKLNNGIELLSMSLAQHLGIPYSDSLDIMVPDFEPDFQSETSSEKWVENRTEYQMLQKAVEAEVYQKRISRGEYLPQLSIGVQGLYLDMMEQENTYGLAFATLSIPISDWWGGAHEMKEHQKKIEIAQNKLEETEELLNLQINKAQKDLLESWEQIHVKEEAVEQAKEHFKVMEDHQREGLVKTSELLEARALLQESTDDLCDAKAHFQMTRATYLKLSGRL
jgi:outer membrane protein TolC